MELEKELKERKIHDLKRYLFLLNIDKWNMNN